MALIYTSGTTGPSKAVLCPYLHHHTYCEQLFPGADETERFFACLPMFHAGGTTAIYGMLECGGSVAITAGFDTSTFLEEVRQYGTTRGVILGAMANFLLARDPGPATPTTRCARRSARRWSPTSRRSAAASASTSWPPTA